MTTQLMRTLLLIACLLNLSSLLAQPTNLGLPSLRNFNKQTYQGGTQSWDFAQDDLGRLYIANNEGLLVFDGVNWQRYPLPKQTIMRSLALLPDGRILVGGQGELGYFQSDEQGRLRYQSLVGRLPDSLRNFADVWDIEVQGDTAYLRTLHLLMRYHGEQLTVLSYSPEAEYRSLSLVEGQMWVHTEAQGLCRWQADQLEPVLSGSAWQDRLVIEVLPWPQGQQLIVTLESGVWLLAGRSATPWLLSHDSLLQALRIHSACLLSEQRIALGTALGGLLIADVQGRVVQHLDQARGLQDNNIQALFADRNQNLWLGLNYGIDFLELNSPLHRVYPDGDLRGTAYAAAFFRGRLYLGTSNGLYVVPWQDYYNPTHGSPWTLVAGTQGQVWSLDTIGGYLLMGHNKGAFVVEGKGARHIPGTEGVWTFLRPQGHPDHLIAGTYQGLIRLAITPQGLALVGRIAGLAESSRFLVQDQPGRLWMSHPYRGVFRLDLDDSLTQVQAQRYGQADGLPSDLQNHVFSLNGEVVFAGQRGVFVFDSGTKRFVPYAAFADVFGPEQRIIRLREDAQGNVWYVSDQEVGVLWIDDRGLRKQIERQTIPSLQDRLVGGFELVYPMDPHHVWFGVEKGFVRYDALAAAVPQRPWLALVSEVMTTGHAPHRIYGGHGDSSQVYRYSHQDNALRFSCGATRYVDPYGLQFRYRLLGLAPNWEAWSDLPVKEYTNLSAGDYRFEVQARDGMGGLSQPTTFAFAIEPAWYASPAAWVAYSLMGVLILVGLILLPRQHFEKEKAELQQVHQLQQAAQQQQIKLTQAQVEALEREKLEADNRHKSQELATATMHLVQKNEVIAHLRSELESLAKRHADHPGAKELRDLARMLGHDQQFEADWEQFASHFDQVHAGFLRRLREQYPQLTPKDQRLCAYLRMNLSTKEIAPLMNISVRGVEISRYRLRKKLDLDREVNLNEFMMSF